MADLAAQSAQGAAPHPAALPAAGAGGAVPAAAVQAHSEYWAQAREHRTMKMRSKPPAYDAEDPSTWLRMMEQFLRLQGMADAITQEPRFDGLLLRARPSDRTGHAWDEINGRVLSADDASKFVRLTDTFSVLQSTLSHAPAVIRQLSVTVEDGNAKALWDAIRAHITETRGESGARLLAKLVAARMRGDETPLEYGRRLQAELVAVRAHGRDLDDDLLKDRFVNFMVPAYAHTAELLALHRKKSTLDELIDMAGDIGAAQASIAQQRAPKGGKQHHGDAATDLKKGCFKCGAHDHIKAHCPLLKGGVKDSSSRSSGSKSRQTCAVCQKPGHATDRCFMLERAEKVIRERGHASADKGHGGRPAEAQAAVQDSLHHGYHVNTDMSAKRLLDSAASTHMQGASLPVRRDLGVAADEKIRIASGRMLEKPRRAEVDLPLKDGSTFALRDVLTHPEMRTNLVSVGALLDDPEVEEVKFRRECAAVLDSSGDIVMTARRENGVYVVDTANAAEMQTAAAATTTAQLWHQRACHLSESTLADTARAGVLEEGDQFRRKAIDERKTCEPCIMAKMTRSPFGAKVRDELRARRTLERVHMDTSGPYPEGPNGERYRVNIKDEYSGQKQILITATKAQISSAVVAWAKAMQNKLGLTIAELHFDGGSEFKADLQKWGQQDGTNTTFGPKDTPQLNGRAERAVRTIDTLQNAAMHAAGAPIHLWPYASKHAVAVCNRFMLCPNDPKRTRHQVFFNLQGPTSVSEIKVWGCRAYAHRQSEAGDTKLASKAVPCSNLGYDYNRSSYTLIDDNGRIFQSRDVKFIEDSFAGMRELTDDDDGADERPYVGSNTSSGYTPKGDMARSCWM